MNVEEAKLEIEHRLARHAEPEVPRFNDACMHRPDRHLENTFSFDFPEIVPLSLKWRQLSAQVEILPQGIYLRPVVVQRAAARIGVADQFQAEQVLNLAFLPIDRWDGISE